MLLPKKHSAIGTTVFTVMSTLAQEYNAVNLSQGFPDFSIDPKLGDLVSEAIRNGANQYAPMPGLPALREAIASDFLNRYRISVDPGTEITITPGATYAIYTSFATILEPGDEVIVLEPAYDSYIPNIEMCGAKAIKVKLLSPEFTPDWERISAAVNKRTKAIIVNTPHNPTGAIWTDEDWHALTAIATRNDLLIVSDEVYEQLVYDKGVHRSALHFPELRKRTFAIFSFGKVFHNTGWKIGYCIAPPALTAAFRRIHQFLAFSVNTPMQHGIAAYLALPGKAWVADMLEAKRNYFLQLMSELPFTILQPAAGSYFQIASYKGLSELADTAFAEMLTKEYGVATIPVSAFYSDRHDEHLLRFCFAKKEETLKEAAGRLSAFAEAIRK